nr:peroxiredoxin [Bacteriovorax sp. HI3]
MMKDLFNLPKDLPAPHDDGAADHLEGMSLPSLVLHTTEDREVNIRNLAKQPTIIFFYPRTGVPNESVPEGWDMIPGARGCTPQSCGFRDLHQEFKTLGYAVFGASTQTTEFQQEFVERNHIPFEILSDEDLALTEALELPTFEFNGETLIKRMVLILENEKIEKVFYPVFPPDKNAEVVLGWIQSQLK